MNNGHEGFGGGTIAQLEALSNGAVSHATADPLATPPGQFDPGEPVIAIDTDGGKGRIMGTVGGGSYIIEFEDGTTSEVHRTRLARPFADHPDYAQAVSTVRAEQAGDLAGGAADRWIRQVAADTRNDEHAILVAVLNEAAAHR